jgi:hypothetical protein
LSLDRRLPETTGTRGCQRPTRPRPLISQEHPSDVRMSAWSVPTFADTSPGALALDRA